MHAEWARTLVTGDRGPVRVQVAALMIKISCDNKYLYNCTAEYALTVTWSYNKVDLSSCPVPCSLL
jgi:hypothetical protein